MSDEERAAELQKLYVQESSEMTEEASTSPKPEIVEDTEPEENRLRAGMFL